MKLFLEAMKVELPLLEEIWDVEDERVSESDRKLRVAKLEYVSVAVLSGSKETVWVDKLGVLFGRVRVSVKLQVLVCDSRSVSVESKETVLESVNVFVTVCSTVADMVT